MLNDGLIVFVAPCALRIDRRQFRANARWVDTVTVIADKMPEIIANDETELTSSLAKIFNALSTVETVQRLMSLTQQ